MMLICMMIVDNNDLCLRLWCHLLFLRNTQKQLCFCSIIHFHPEHDGKFIKINLVLSFPHLWKTTHWLWPSSVHVQNFMFAVDYFITWSISLHYCAVWFDVPYYDPEETRGAALKVNSITEPQSVLWYKEAPLCSVSLNSLRLFVFSILVFLLWLQSSSCSFYC